MSQGGGEKGAGPALRGRGGAGPGRERLAQWGRGPGAGPAPRGIRPGPAAAGASANSPRSRPVAPFKGEDVQGAGDGLGIYFQSVDTYGGRSPGRVSA